MTVDGEQLFRQVYTFSPLSIRHPNLEDVQFQKSMHHGFFNAWKAK